MLELGFTEEVHGHKVRKAEGIKANVTDISLQVRGVLEKGKGRTGLVGRRGLSSSILKELGGMTACFLRGSDKGERMSSISLQRPKDQGIKDLDMTMEHSIQINGAYP
jgi:hypothetical protein